MPVPPTPIGLPQILLLLVTVGLGSSVVAAVVSQVMAGHREKAAQKKDGQFVAYELALALEAYAETCSSVIYDSENHKSSRGAGGELHLRLPRLPDYPEVNWRSLGIEDTVRVKSFRTNLDFEHGQIAFDSEHASEGDEWRIGQEVRHRAARIGLEAAALAMRLRADRRIDKLKHNFAYGHLRESVETYRKDDLLASERAEEIRQMVDDAAAKAALELKVRP